MVRRWDAETHMRHGEPEGRRPGTPYHADHPFLPERIAELQIGNGRWWTPDAKLELGDPTMAIPQRD
jgi:hypothetical protein